MLGCGGESQFFLLHIIYRSVTVYLLLLSYLPSAQQWGSTNICIYMYTHKLHKHTNIYNVYILYNFLISYHMVLTFFTIRAVTQTRIIRFLM